MVSAPGLASEPQLADWVQRELLAKVERHRPKALAAVGVGTYFLPEERLADVIAP